MTHPLPILQLLFAALLFGASNVVQKLIFVDLDAWSSLGLRGLFACLALAPVAVFELRRFGLKLGQVARISFPVSLFFFVGMLTQLLGAEQTSATNVGFLINTCVVFTPFLIWVLTGQRPSATVLSATALCFIGVALLSGSMPTAFGAGDLWCVVSALSYAAWIISLGKVMRVVNTPVTVTALQWLVPAVVGLSVGGDAINATVFAKQLPNLLFLGVIVGAFGFMLAAKAQEKLPPCTAAVCYSTEAVFGAIVAYAWVGESLSQMGIAGAAMTLASILLVQCVPVGKIESRKVQQSYQRIEPRLV